MATDGQATKQWGKIRWEFIFLFLLLFTLQCNRDCSVTWGIIPYTVYIHTDIYSENFFCSDSFISIQTSWVRIHSLVLWAVGDPIPLIGQCVCVCVTTHEPHPYFLCGRTVPSVPSSHRPAPLPYTDTITVIHWPFTEQPIEGNHEWDSKWMTCSIQLIPMQAKEIAS